MTVLIIYPREIKTYIHTHKKNELLINAKSQMDLKGIMLNEKKANLKGLLTRRFCIFNTLEVAELQ